MKKWFVLLTVIMFVGSSIAVAVPGKKTLTFDKSPQGVVTFDGTIHKEAGMKCKDCHNKEMFPKMKKGTVTITMNDIYASKLCGVCHNGSKAFDAKTNCDRCHKN